jgi:hypothetical protein
MWVDLPTSTRQQLAFRWIDQTIRRVLPDLLKRSGSTFGRYLESLPEIVDAGKLALAQSTLADLVDKLRGEEQMVSVSLCSVLDWLKEVGESPSIERACLLAVMTSRLAFGDDRITLGMLTELEMAALRLPPRSQ